MIWRSQDYQTWHTCKWPREQLSSKMAIESRGEKWGQRSATGRVYRQAIVHSYVLNDKPCQRIKLREHLHYFGFIGVESVVRRVESLVLYISIKHWLELRCDDDKTMIRQRYDKLLWLHLQYDDTTVIKHFYNNAVTFWRNWHIVWFSEVILENLCLFLQIARQGVIPFPHSLNFYVPYLPNGVWAVLQWLMSEVWTLLTTPTTDTLIKTFLLRVGQSLATFFSPMFDLKSENQ